MDPQERLLLESLDSLLQSDAARAGIRPIVEQVRRKLAQDRAAPMAWAPVPLPVYGRPLPEPIQSSWVFILRARTATGAERHPNSHQRMVSYEGSGDLQTGGEGQWQSHPLISEAGAALEQRWVSVPPNVWHQAVVPDQDWVVVSFHTVPADDLVEERPHAGDVSRTHQRRYLARPAEGDAPALRIRNATEADLPVIVDIYNQSIPAGWSTADTKLISVADRVEWFRKFDPARRPIWVAEVDGRVVGTVYLSSFYGGRPAYDATAEVSVYIATAYQRRGIGRRLKQWVIEQCPRLGVTTLLSMHFDHNEATRRINASLGFEQCGHLKEIAVVQGRRRGLVIWALRIPPPVAEEQVRPHGRPGSVVPPDGPTEQVRISPEENKALVRRYYEEMWNRWDLSLADVLLGEGLAFRGSLGVTVQGREEFKDYMRAVRRAFPDFHNRIEELVAEGNKVVARLTYTGTHHGAVFGIGPTGKRVTYSGVAVFAIEAGRITEGWVLGDVHALLLQLSGDGT